VPRNPVPILVTLTVLIALAGAYGLFQATETHRYQASRGVLEARSVLALSLKMRHARGPIAEEDYVMSDDDGISKSRYRAIARSGLTITVDERPRRTLEEGANVAYLFQQADQDGIWELQSKPPRGDTSTSYTVDVAQRIGDQHGSHEFTFTDPHFWATTVGHEFHITLSKSKPLPDLLSLRGTALVEGRYQTVINDFLSFGPQSFRADIASAQSRLKAHG